MNTKDANSNVSPCEEGCITIIHYIPGPRIQDRFTRKMRQVVRWFRVLITTALGVAALEPNIFKVSLHAQGWVLIGFILWIFILCSGVLNV